MKKRLIMALLMVGFLLTGTTVYAGPFGNPADVEDAKTIWKVLVKENLVGPGMVNSVPFEGQEPHGAILESLDKRINHRKRSLGRGDRQAELRWQGREQACRG